MNLIYDEDPDYIVVFGADHVYRMDPEQMLQFHIESGAGATVAGIRVPRAEASAFGCIDSDESGRIRSFIEKPADPPGTPDDPEQTFVSMGNYIFTTKVLIDAIRADAEDDDSDHDMGGDIIPRLVSDGMAAVYDFNNNEVPGATERDHGYWRDVGTLDAFYDAHMDLVSVHPIFNLYNKRWPIRGVAENLAPAKFVNGGSAQESVVGAGSIISAASVRNSVLSSNVYIDDGAIVEGSVIMPGTRIGRGAVVRHAILDKNVVVGPGRWSASTSTRTVNGSRSAPAVSSPSARASGSDRLPEPRDQAEAHGLTVVTVAGQLGDQQLLLVEDPHHQDRYPGEHGQQSPVGAECQRHTGHHDHRARVHGMAHDAVEPGRDHRLPGFHGDRGGGVTVLDDDQFGHAQAAEHREVADDDDRDGHV